MTRKIELTDACDYGDAPQILATSVARMYMLSPSIVRVVFARTHVDDDSVERHRVTGHMDVDIVQLPEILRLIEQGLEALQEQSERPPRGVPLRPVN